MKLVTWNIQWGRGCDGRVDLDRIVSHARRLAEFDVLCVQEVSDGYPELAGCDGGNQFAALAERLPGYAAVEGPAIDAPRPGGGRRRFGNMILSRLPVGPVFRHLLPWPADEGRKSMQRIALEATVEAPFGPLRVLTTHLEYYSPRQRAAQVERLRELQAEGWARARHAGDGGDGPFDNLRRGAAAVLVGDFNFRPEAEERRRLQAGQGDGAPAWRDAWELLHSDRPHPPSVGLYDREQWPDEPFTFDFAFVTSDIAGRVRSVQVDARSDASDHQPVLLELD